MAKDATKAVDDKAMSVDAKARLCGSCGLELGAREPGIRHFGFFESHSEYRCIQLLQIKQQALADEVDRLQEKNDELRQDRADALSVTSKEGLLSSEWIARTGKAERITKDLKKEVDRLSKESFDYRDAWMELSTKHEALLAEVDRLRARLEEFVERQVFDE